MNPQQIAALVGTDETHVRKVIHAFDERGFSSLDPEPRAGRPRRITAKQRARIIAVADARPDALGVPATRWSLVRLARYLTQQQIVQVSPAHLGRSLKAADLSFQRTRTWKASPDPDYEPKAARVLALYAKAPENGVVISFDQMGPISLRPTAGTGWAPRNANWTPDVRAFADANNIELIPTPTYASYLDRIECHFLPISEFVVKNADHLKWDALAHAVARHVTYRNGEHRNQRLITLERRRQIAA